MPLKDEFLLEIAARCDFSYDEQDVFLTRFDPKFKALDHKEIVSNQDLWKDSYEKKAKEKKWKDTERSLIEKRTTKFQDRLDEVLKKLYEAYKQQGCPETKVERGRPKKGESPWELRYNWLWEEEYPSWRRMREIDWLDICSRMLDRQQQRQATSNPMQHEYEDTQFKHEQIYVPLALVQRTKPDKRSGKFSPEAGTLVYEPQYEQKQRFEHENFLTQILEQGQGKTNGKRIALIGEPGAGKTTLLQHIAYWLLGKTQSSRQQENKDVAIRISLAELQGRSLEEYLREKWLKDALGVANVTPDQKNTLVELFKSGRVWLLLDGVDEMTSGEEPRKAIADEMTGWVASARVVLTCRLNLWQANVNLLFDFETYRLLDFDYPLLVHEFINKWFSKSDPANGEQLKAELNKPEQARLRNLVQNPLRLMLLCSIWTSLEGNLPHTKAGLYYRYVEQFYRWKEELKIGIETQKLNSALGRLALRDIDEGGSRFWLRESFIKEELDNGKKPLIHPALEVGWLNDVGIAADFDTGEKAYAFFHPTFEEYFAALAINDWHFFLNHIPNHPNHPDANYRIFEPQWKEVILLWLGREDVPKEQKEELIQALVEFEDGCKFFYSWRAFFLAAAGIAEFEHCSTADEIVQLIVEWGFGYFNEEKKWVRFDEIFAQRARAVLPETKRTKAIKALEDLIQNCVKEYVLWQAAKSLWDLHPGNPTAIKTLEDLIQNCKDEYFLWLVAESLGEISSNNPTAINALVGLMQNSQDEHICDNACFTLKEIGSNNPTVIKALEELIQNSQAEDTLVRAAMSLGKIGSNNHTAIKALEELIQNTQHKPTLMQAVMSLGEIGSNNPTAIKALEELIQNSQDESICLQAAECLGKIDSSNPKAINALVALTQDSVNENILFLAAEVLEKIHSGKPTSFEIIRDDFLQSNEKHTLEIEKRIKNQKDIFNNKDILEYKDLFGDEDNCWKRVVGLKKFLGKVHQMAQVVTLMKDYLSNETWENDYERYQYCGDVVWHCAETLPYPTFYQAWHHPQLTLHPEPETTGVGLTPDSQSLNLADLPNLLQANVNSDSDLRDRVQLVCIDGGKFADRDNPVLKIYREMQSQGCPIYSDGRPTGIAQLQDYWDELRQDSDKQVVLVFYENSTAPQGFSETFLDALSRFAGTICVISNQPNIPLQAFSPSLPNLANDVMSWMRRILLENF
ncbi:hypothetical protein C7B80_02920 [Cyanosarcina cf. burmensis CCALA 770]|nr:hypothetical protein C7B80_02920 [Cyanosarcina cf. burmensis CCALA 770]